MDGAESPGTKNELMKMWKLEPGDPDDEIIFSQKIKKAENNFEIVVLEI